MRAVPGRPGRRAGLVREIRSLLRPAPALRIRRRQAALRHVQPGGDRPAAGSGAHAADPALQRLGDGAGRRVPEERPGHPAGAEEHPERLYHPQHRLSGPVQRLGAADHLRAAGGMVQRRPGLRIRGPARREPDEGRHDDGGRGQHRIAHLRQGTAPSPVRHGPGGRGPHGGQQAAGRWRRSRTFPCSAWWRGSWSRRAWS